MVFGLNPAKFIRGFNRQNLPIFDGFSQNEGKFGLKATLRGNPLLNLSSSTAN